MLKSMRERMLKEQGFEVPDVYTAIVTGIPVQTGRPGKYKTEQTITFLYGPDIEYPHLNSSNPILRNDANAFRQYRRLGSMKIGCESEPMKYTKLASGNGIPMYVSKDIIGNGGRNAFPYGKGMVFSMFKRNNLLDLIDTDVIPYLLRRRDIHAEHMASVRDELLGFCGRMNAGMAA